MYKIFFTIFVIAEEDLPKPPNFYRDIVGSDKVSLLRYCVGTL